MQDICSMGNTNEIWFMSFRSLESSEVMDQCTYCNQLSCNGIVIIAIRKFIQSFNKYWQALCKL